MIKRFSDPQRTVQENYYPMASGMFIENFNERMTILSGQPHGVTLIQPGTVEIMLDRRLTVGDGKGLNEPMRDNLPTESIFWLIFERKTSEVSLFCQNPGEKSE